MKAVMLMFDSLNRHMLSTYGCTWTVTPNFERLASRTVKFDTSYVCSMPCMPARRDFHTGRPNFLHRGWGPLEPWDDSVPAMLKNAGVYTHICTDHQHYWEEGAGGNYLSKYNTHAMYRGQEGDPYYPMLEPPAVPKTAIGRNANPNQWYEMDRINRSQIHSEKDMPIAKTFADGMDFIRRHAEMDNWFLQIETFDPHEPFFTLPEHKEAYEAFYQKSRELIFDWPVYDQVKESPEEVEHMRHGYAALMTLCDSYVGKIIDLMDEHDLWNDTMLIVWTDHGFCLGEHDSWAKCWLPFYEELARTPFFVWDPRSGKRGESRQSLVQPSIDLGPTLLDFFGLEVTKDMTGKPLKEVIERDSPIRETAIFGIFGGQVNITDGRYVYMRGPHNEDNDPLYHYTMMPAGMREVFPLSWLRESELSESFSFTKGVPTVKIPMLDKDPLKPGSKKNKTLLFDLEKDPAQKNPVENEAMEAHFCDLLRKHMKAVDAPLEQYSRLGL